MRKRGNRRKKWAILQIMSMFSALPVTYNPKVSQDCNKQPQKLWIGFSFGEWFYFLPAYNPLTYKLTLSKPLSKFELANLNSQPLLSLFSLLRRMLQADIQDQYQFRSKHMVERICMNYTVLGLIPLLCMHNINQGITTFSKITWMRKVLPYQTQENFTIQ